MNAERSTRNSYKLEGARGKNEVGISLKVLSKICEILRNCMRV
jgi:hypothetical protein